MKVIAIGNILMEDDGVAIVVIKKLKEKLEKRNIQVIIGETDFDYCISLIKDGDFIFFIDATYYEKNPGEITVVPMENYVYKKKYYTQHSYSLVDLVKLYFKNIKGYIIGIEIGEVAFNYGLSNILEGKIEHISKEIFKEIISRAEEMK